MKFPFVRDLRLHRRRLQAMRAFSSATAGPVFGHLLLGLADLAAGVVARAGQGFSGITTAGSDGLRRALPRATS